MRSLLLPQISKILHRQDSLPNAPVSGYCVDSRLLKKNELFFALKGDRVDGHDYLFEIHKNGAVAAIISNSYNGPIPGNLLLIRVDDPLKALQEIAGRVLSESPSRIVGITGSIGKTTTKTFIHTLLSGKFRTGASPGNSNSQIGLPLSILNHTTGDEEVLILEMGMTHPGQIAQLIQIAPPEVSVLTSVSLVHACNFNALEEIAWAKAEIFQHGHTKLGIMHRDIPCFEEIAAATPCRKITFSLTSQSADYTVDPAHPTQLTSNLEGLSILTDGLKLPGKHNLHNLLAAVAVARHFNVCRNEIQERLGLLQLPAQRLEQVIHQKIHFINDSYNAAELSVKAALESMPMPVESGRKIAVLGSMMELGKFSGECHKRVGEHALNYVEEIYCFGEECRPIYEVWKSAGKKVELFHDFSDLLSCLRDTLKPSDVVLIKGSLSKQMWKILEEL
jgi:UDP-N-acetylmuramoyl-tripeptide--D-alanyl-D-alanine ligase